MFVRILCSPAAMGRGVLSKKEAPRVSGALLGSARRGRSGAGGTNLSRQTSLVRRVHDRFEPNVPLILGPGGGELVRFIVPRICVDGCLEAVTGASAQAKAPRTRLKGPWRQCRAENSVILHTPKENFGTGACAGNLRSANPRGTSAPIVGA